MFDCRDQGKYDAQTQLCLTCGQPKWGFLPSPDNKALSAETRDAKINYCRRCMQREILKATDPSEWRERFCALHLYNGNPTKDTDQTLLRALFGLYYEWLGTTVESNYNTFKVFIGKDRINPQVSKT